MQIFVREHKVRTQRVTSLLRSKLHERFTPRNTAPGVYADIEMGFNTEVRLPLSSIADQSTPAGYLSRR